MSVPVCFNPACKHHETILPDYMDDATMIIPPGAEASFKEIHSLHGKVQMIPTKIDGIPRHKHETAMGDVLWFCDTCHSAIDHHVYMGPESYICYNKKCEYHVCIKPYQAAMAKMTIIIPQVMGHHVPSPLDVFAYTQAQTKEVGRHKYIHPHDNFQPHWVDPLKKFEAPNMFYLCDCCHEANQTIERIMNWNLHNGAY